METWIYIGRRTLVGGKTGYFYLQGDKERAFRKPLLAGTPVGAELEVDVEVKEKSVSVKGTPRYLGRADQHPDLDSWRAADLAVQLEKTQAARLRKDSVDEELQDALDVLRRRMAAARTWDSMAAFAAYVGEQIRKPARET